MEGKGAITVNVNWFKEPEHVVYVEAERFLPEFSRKVKLPDLPAQVEAFRAQPTPEGKNIRTLEGLEKNGELTRIQEAFIEEGAVQCGFCTPGFIMSATVLLEQGKELSREEIKKKMSGNLCRCS